MRSLATQSVQLVELVLSCLLRLHMVQLFAGYVIKELDAVVLTRVLFHVRRLLASKVRDGELRRSSSLSSISAHLILFFPHLGVEMELLQVQKLIALEPLLLTVTSVSSGLGVDDDDDVAGGGGIATTSPSMEVFLLFSWSEFSIVLAKM